MASTVQFELSTSPPPLNITLDSEAPAKKKRNRKAVSCTQCRSRKVKCDRSYPCSSCRVRGEVCTWHGGAEPARESEMSHQDLITECKRLHRVVRDFARRSGASQEEIENCLAPSLGLVAGKKRAFAQVKQETLSDSGEEFLPAVKREDSSPSEDSGDSPGDFQPFSMAPAISFPAPAPPSAFSAPPLSAATLSMLSAWSSHPPTPAASPFLPTSDSPRSSISGDGFDGMRSIALSSMLGAAPPSAMPWPPAQVIAPWQM